MVNYLTKEQLLLIHVRCLQQSGGIEGIREERGLDSALALPKQGFGGVEFYPTIVEKAAVLGFAIILNHPFLDGNKRTGFLAMELYLMINGYEIVELVEIMEEMILRVAAGEVKKDEFTDWLRTRVFPRNPT